MFESRFWHLYPPRVLRGPLEKYWFKQKHAPTGIRIPVLALRGPRPRPLDDGGVHDILTQTKTTVNETL